MRALNRFSARLFYFATRRRASERFQEEAETHLALQTEENILSGMTPEEAYRQARLKFGSAESAQETYVAEQRFSWLEHLLLDVRYALRVLRKSPAFTVVALITLMLGIGANVVVFGILNAVLLHPLEVNHPQDLYQLRHGHWMMGRLLTTSYPDYEDLQRRNTTFTGLIGINAYSSAILHWQHAVLSVSGEEVTSNYFDLLGVQPQLGQFFHSVQEHGANSVPYVVLSDKLWRNTFHADPNIVGTTVEMNKHPFTVVGVAQTQFHGTEKFSRPDYWIPMANQAEIGSEDYLRDRASVALTVIGRLKPGVTSQQATDDLNKITSQLAKEFPETNDGQPLRLIHPGLIGDEGDVIRRFLYSVSLLALLVLLAACANLATLFAARTADRSRELALRVALGSSRARIVKQLLTEAMLVSLLGGAAGLAAAHLLIRVLNRTSPFAGSLTVLVEPRVYLVGLALTMGSALLFGLVPARHGWQSSPAQMMKDEPATPRGFGRFALRDVLLGAQITICTLLVAASLVAVRGLIATLNAPLGFQPQNALLVEEDLSEAAPTSQAPLVQQKAIIEALQSFPGVTAVGAVSRIPMTGGMRGVPIFAPGTTEFKLDHSELAPYVFSVSPGYLKAAGTRVLSGRDLSWEDTTDTPYVAIVNQAFAQKLWGHAPAIGQRFILSGKLTEVVGVAEDGKYHDIQESPQPVLYRPLSQSDNSGATFVVRSQRMPNEMESALKQTLNAIEPNTPITVQRWTDAMRYELFPARAATAVLGVMGLLAAMLAVTGIFGMAAYSVSQRMKELGIRMALGARKTQVMTAAIGRPILLLGMGSILGLLAGAFAQPLLRQIVYQANPRDPIVVLGAVLTMALLGVGASAIPARRALRVDPSKLMRHE